MSSDLRVTLAQLNPTVGDIDGNIDLMLAAANKAVADGASLVVFPELSLTGYYPADLLDEPDFLARVDTGLDRLLSLTRSTPGLHWVVGAPCRREGPGKPLHNCLLVLADGVIRIGDSDGRLKEWFGRYPASVALVRPDRFLAALAIPQTLGKTCDALAQAVYATTPAATRPAISKVA